MADGPAELGALPIGRCLPELVSILAQQRTLVLTAPPGAGKTTGVPLALLDAAVLPPGRIVVAQPRRLAARAVARRMAALRSEALGRTIGYRVRFDDRSSPETRVLVVTEGILLRQILADPFLEGVACVLLDEFHERSVNQDLLLACLRQIQEVRSDLRLLVMSATLEVEPVRRYLGGCAHLDCPGRAHPLSVEYLGLDSTRRLEVRLVAGVRRLLGDAADDGGDILAFLPGAGPIRRAQEALAAADLPGRPQLVPLYGALSAALQDAALRPGERRRLVLATNIAETSLTVPGVTAVIDSGLVKRLRSDPAKGMDRLLTERVSKASAQQRAGRAGRLGPGRVLRLWSREEHSGLAEAETPEVARVDLAGVILTVLAFQPGPLDAFPFLDRPPASHLDAAMDLLRLLGAIGSDRASLTERGLRWASLPLHPRLAAMLELAARSGQIEEGALQAALLAEPDPLRRTGGRSVDLPDGDSDLFFVRDACLAVESRRFDAAEASRQGVDAGAVRRLFQVRDQLLRQGRDLFETRSGAVPAAPAAARRLPLAGFPDRVCRRRAPGKNEALMRGGHGVRLADESSVRRPDLFVALKADAGPRGLHQTALVRWAHAVSEDDLRAVFPGLLREGIEAVFDPTREAVVGLRRSWFDDLLLAEQSGVTVPADQAAALLAEQVQRDPARAFRPNQDGQRLLDRLRFAAVHLPETGWPRLDEAGLAALTASVCAGRRSFEELRRLDWTAVLRGRLDWKAARLLEEEVPERIVVPSGNRIRIDYAQALAPDGAPVLAVKLQEMFGLADTPRIARGRVPLRLHLLAPSGRPVQVTSDLRSFWDAVYPQVRRDLRGRYPKHPWPDDPWTAPPTARTKRRR